MKQISNGVFPTMITPYTEDNKIDFDAVEQLLDYYKRSGCAGVFAICQSSEIFYLSFEERLELLSFIMDHKPTGLEIIASGNTEDDPALIVDHAKAFIDTGISAYVFISNRFARADDNDDVLLDNMFSAIDLIDRDIGYGVYECPHPYKRLLTPYVMKQMALSGRFIFLKDTCCDLGAVKAKLDSVKGSDFKIYNANAAMILESLKMGCAGFSGIMANFHAELYTEMCRIWQTDPDKAQIIQDFVGFASLAEGQYYPVNAKYYRQLCGMRINIDSRARDKNGFSLNDIYQIKEMKAATERFTLSVLGRLPY